MNKNHTKSGTQSIVWAVSVLVCMSVASAAPALAQSGDDECGVISTRTNCETTEMESDDVLPEVAMDSLAATGAMDQNSTLLEEVTKEETTYSAPALADTAEDAAKDSARSGRAIADGSRAGRGVELTTLKSLGGGAAIMLGVVLIGRYFWLGR